MIYSKIIRLKIMKRKLLEMVLIKSRENLKLQIFLVVREIEAGQGLRKLLRRTNLGRK